MVAALIVACSPYVKKGDRAAAVGSWKQAVANYHRALQKDPNDKSLRNKYDNAKREAIVQAIQIAKRCTIEEDFRCADVESNYVLTLDPANQQAAALWAKSKRRTGLTLVARARTQANRGDYLGALRSLQRATTDSRDEQVKERASKLFSEVAADAAAHAKKLYIQAHGQEVGARVQTLRKARDILAYLSERDADHRALLAEVKAAHEVAASKFASEMAEKANKAMAARSWSEAARLYTKVAKVDRAYATKAQHALLLAEAEALVAGHQYDEAAKSLELAIKTGEDRAQSARQMLNATAPKLYRVTLDWVTLSPYKPQTKEPWVGKPDGALATLVGLGVGVFFASPTAGVGAKQLVGLAQKIRHDNRPKVQLRVTLPDGREFVATKKGLYIDFGVSFVVESNHHDARPVVFRLVHKKGSRTYDMGSLSVPLGKLIGEKTVEFSAAVLGARFSVVEGGMLGDVRGMKAVSKDNKAKKQSLPSKNATGYKLSSITTVITDADISDGVLDGDPDPYVKILQGGDVVLKTATVQDDRNTTWRFSASYLFVKSKESLQLQLWDADAGADELIGKWNIPASSLASGTVKLRLKGGTTVSVTTEPRQVGPR